MPLNLWARPTLSIALVAVLSLLLVACGSGSNVVKSGSGESGVGGTGISLVKGNVSNIDGLGQGSKQFSNTTVSAGSSQSQLDTNGSFILPGVAASDNLALDFSDGNGTTVTLPVGAITKGATIEIIDVQISYVAGSVTARSIRVIPPDTGDTDASGAAGPVADSQPTNAPVPDSETPVSGGGGGGSGSGGGGETAQTSTPPPPVEEPLAEAPPADTPETSGDTGSSGSGSKLGAFLGWLYNEIQERREQRDQSNDDEEA